MVDPRRLRRSTLRWTPLSPAAARKLVFHIDDVTEGPAHVPEGFEMRDAITYELIRRGHKAYYIVPNVHDGRIMHVYSKNTMHTLLEKSPTVSPYTRRPFGLDSIALVRQTQDGTRR